ncbi:MAG: hypothetical protein GY833_22680 [Aestuariibacter sp.]|nr:hypothetical protein [Aestuariibacter sp.]|tara:strand:+ start:230775 stop:231266 length:492 start_codon:yes stop_codon:yes gene_type:complete
MTVISSAPLYQVVRQFVPHCTLGTSECNWVKALALYLERFPEFDPVHPVADSIEMTADGFYITVKAKAVSDLSDVVKKLAWLESIVKNPDAPKNWTHVTGEGAYVRYSKHSEYGHQYFLYKTSYSGWDTQFASSIPDLRAREDLELLLNLLAPLNDWPNQGKN